jgi:hypothetical protein
MERIVEGQGKNALSMKHRVRVREFAKANNMSPTQVRNLIRDGIIPAIVIKRLILIDPEEADRALERFRRGPKPESDKLPP